MSLEKWLTLVDSTDKLITGSGVLSQFEAAYRELWQQKQVYLVADENTLPLVNFDNPGLLFLKEPAGKTIFPGEPALTADYIHVETLKKAFGNFPDAVPVVIGSGTLNDLVKRASAECDRTYAVIATAASVDGYASEGAALVLEGVKQTLLCPAPKLILGDTDILSTAPYDMTAAGYADLAAKIPAGADWILADILGEEPVDETVWQMVQVPLRSWIADPEGLKLGRQKPLVDLFEGLNVSGLGMQYLKNSRPAAGAEHLLSHIWEMQGYTWKGKHFSHGFKVALGSLWTIKTMHWLINRGISSVDYDRALANMPNPEQREKRIPELFEFIKDKNALYVVNKQKYPGPAAFHTRIDLIRDSWDALTGKWSDYLPSEEEFTNWFKKAGCPSSPSDLGMTWADVGKTMVLAQYLRYRYTVMDLVSDLNLMDELQKYLEGI